ncbi:MAG: hypothetical protein ACI8R9_000597 [Paraglaciecola sp.]|jgi:hypothetical protein
MRKRATINNRPRILTAGRRRLVIKRVHHKIVLRRQQFLMTEQTEEMSLAS